MAKFTVWSHSTSRDIGDRDTFEAAETLARWHAARRGVRIQIDHRQLGKTENVASVIRDAFGRLWTDLTFQGSELV